MHPLDISNKDTRQSSFLFTFSFYLFCHTVIEILFLSLEFNYIFHPPIELVMYGIFQFGCWMKIPFSF